MIDQQYLQCRFFSDGKDGGRKKKVPVSRTYRIGEAARILKVETSTLRFWEDVFPELNPARTPKKQRVYTQRDMDLLRRIRTLLYDQGMTIEGARKVLDQGSFLPQAQRAVREQARTAADLRTNAFLREILEELKAVRKMLSAGQGSGRS